MYATPFYSQQRPQEFYNSNNVIKMDSTTTSSSVFSNNDMDYAARVKEMEEYYLKTLLTEDEDDEIKLNTSTSAFSNDDVYSSDSTSTSSPSSPNNIAKLNNFYNPFLTNSNNYYNTTIHVPHPEPTLEVEINNAFNPSISSLPLTSENLEKLGQNSLSNQQLAQQQLRMLQTQFVDTSIMSQQRLSHNMTKKLSQKDSNPDQINKQLYKTELCESFTTKGACKYGNKCQFAHGLEELKLKERRNNFRTKPCVNWAKLGYCPYGKRCCFKHGNDRDIQIYVNAGAIKKHEDTAHQSNEASVQVKKHLHPNVKKLQRMTW